MATAAEYGLGPNTYPRGWFIVAESREIDKGPIGVTFFGRDFALYRGESGNPVMLDAYRLKIIKLVNHHLCKCD